MKKGIKYGIKYFLYYTGILKLMRYLCNKSVKKGNLIILMYHRINDNEYGYASLSVSRHNFEKQLRHLKNNYKVISLDTLCGFIGSRKMPAEDCVVITFDDGYKDNYTNAYPILRKYEVPATIFLTSGHIGNNKVFWWDRVSRIAMATAGKNIKIDLPDESYPKNIKEIFEKHFAGAGVDSIRQVSLVLASLLKSVSEQKKNMILDDLEHKIYALLKNTPNPPPALNWDEVREMSRGGMDFGSHTVTHPILTRVTKKQAKNEILRSKREIEIQIGKKVSHFAYPNGMSSDFDEEIKNILKNSDYLSACSAISGTNDLPADLYALKRKYMGDFGICEFEFSEIFDFLRNLVKRFSKRIRGRSLL